MARPGLRDTDRGYAAILHDLRAVEAMDPKVFVGLLQDKGQERTEDGGITLAGYAAVNEFGSDDGRVPERSFLRSTVDDNRGKYLVALDKLAGKVIDGARKGGPGQGVVALERGLGLLGERARKDVKDTIRDLRDPPNAPMTLAKKYPAENPLIHTKRMSQSISYHVDLTGRGGALTSTRRATRRKLGGAA